MIHAFNSYAEQVVDCLHKEGFYAEANISSETLKKKILEAQISQWNYILGIFFPDEHYFNILVVGTEEQAGRSVNVRIREDVSTRNQGAPMELEEFITKLIKLRDERSLNYALD